MRDPRFALHGPTFHPEEGKESDWPGQAKMAGRPIPVGRVTTAEAFCQWFGSEGFTCTVREVHVRPGGRACFDMSSRDGTVFTNRFEYLEVVPSERLVLDHGSDIDDDPARFRALSNSACGRCTSSLAISRSPEPSRWP
ncbi:MAG: hypothetical protein JWP02_2065 [Acidimicrobiales bacterium]|nr:hypothetical protein [Acidimicrobiales bacterium]